MRTRCPECQTAFRVTPEQLKARAGKVRCGQCQTAFNALDYLLEETIVATSAANEPLAADASHVHESYAAAPQPASVPLPDAPTRVEPALTEPATAATSPDASGEPDASLRILLESTSAPATDAASPAEARHEPSIEPEPSLSEAEARELGKATGLILPREITEVPGYSKWTAGVMATPIDPAGDAPARWPYVMVAICLVLVLIGQVTFRFRSELATSVPMLRPALESFSQALGSNVPLPRRADLVSIEASDLQSDATRSDQLILSATIRNRAPYPQAYPALELALTDTQDTPVARRVFLPDEYLPEVLRTTPAFAAHSDVAVRLWIEAKDIGAAGYRLYVFYP